LIVPNPRFRPNPARAVYVHGAINQEMVQRLTPRIVLFQSQNRSPITVYIDSPGGSIAAMQSLWKLLNVSNQDFDRPCDIITVVTTRAASAAADLLSTGDYAIAFPHSTILYHGSRTFRDLEPTFPLTLETTAVVALMLRMTNEASAVELVRRMESRFMFRFLFSKGQFDSIRQNNPSQPMTDTDCFLALIRDSLSERARKLFETARERQDKYSALLAIAHKASKGKSAAKIEAKRLKAIIDFEVESHKDDKDWTFEGQGLSRLSEDFFLLNEHLASSQDARINKLCTEWGLFSLGSADRVEIDKISDEAEKNAKIIEKVRPLLEPLWAFFVALCHALQEGENDLTATDAFWLGLIDEVAGMKNLRSVRSIAEYKPDPPSPAPPPQLPAPQEQEVK
jgi:hypothetical protein